MASFSVTDIIDQTRLYIGDPKSLEVQAVDETPAIVINHAAPATNLYTDTATGKPAEHFATKNMPLISGCTVQIKGGRWNYHFLGDLSHPYSNQSGRVFYINYWEGLFVVPSGATPIASGERVFLTYSWNEAQEYRFSDTEFRKWIPEGYNYIKEKYTPPYAVSGRGDNLAFLPLPSGLDATLLAFSTSYLMRRALQEEELSEGIFVKDGDVSFDTTKKLAHRGRSLQDVKKDLDSIIDDMAISDLAGAGVRIDVYSTRDWTPNTGIGSDQEYNYLGRFTGGTDVV